MHISKNTKREVHLMRRDIKTAYKKEKHRLLENSRAELRRFYELLGIPEPLDPPKRSVLEEVGNAVSHGLGALLSLAALFLMLGHAKTPAMRLGAVVYFLGLFLMFSSSCFYHAFPHGSALKRLFRRFDYASVYILIGATFYPIVLSLSASSSSFAGILAVQWTVIALGVLTAVIFSPAHLVYPHIALYLILGWSALLILPSIGKSDAGLFYTVLAGGAFYTLGVIPCAIDRRASHFVWHLFVLAGAALQCGGVLNFIYLK